MRPDEIEDIHALPLFAGLSRARLERLIHGGLLQRFPAEAWLFDQGERADFLHVILDGQVQLSARESGGQEAVIEIVEPVDSFILAAALTDQPYLMAAKTLTQARILLMPAETLRLEIAREPALALTMMASLAQQFRRMVRQTKDLKLRTASQRVGCYLYRLAQERGEATSVELPYSKRVLAGRLGMTPENLSRAFAKLRESGVRLDGNRVVVADMAALAAYCQPDSLIDEVESDLAIPLPGQPGSENGAGDGGAP